MYYLSEWEFMQYELAERRLLELRRKNKTELQEAYDGIHPTRSCFDYSIGTIFKESVNTADYAIYLVELREEHERQEEWWGLRATACREAREMLTDEERYYLDFYDYDSYGKREKARKRLRESLINIISSKPELQRKPIPLDESEDLEEADRQIEKMSMKELLKDYWDREEELTEEQLKEKCIRLYKTLEWTYSMIGRELGIEVSRVKKYVNSGEENVSDKKKAPSKTQSFVNSVTVSYLPPTELNEYRSGKKGGSRWFSYEDYLKMKESGMRNAEIALAMGIEPKDLYKRLKAWRHKASSIGC
jgi:DNA-directed RNA polymerase specialized sigma24 family protein